MYYKFEMAKTTDRWILYTFVEGQLTPLSKPFGTKKLAERADEIFGTRTRGSRLNPSFNCLPAVASGVRSRKRVQSPPTPSERNEMAKLYVGSLPHSVTDDSLFQLFEDRGYKPVSALVATDKYSGQSRGFGFVELGPGDNMVQAIGELNGLNIEGRAINVSEARPKESRGGRHRPESGGRSGGGRFGRSGRY